MQLVCFQLFSFYVGWDLSTDIFLDANAGTRALVQAVLGCGRDVVLGLGLGVQKLIVLGD